MVYHGVVARIRIVDEWLRSPVSPPSRQRAIMVIARSWGEQRVLMRAFASCDDQTRPTIDLRGEVLAIGPAGTDPHGEWGIHVSPPVDGKAQEIRQALHLAAKLLAGSKGTPARLQDEESEFDVRATQHWDPGPEARGNEKSSYCEPAVGAPSATSTPRASSLAAGSSAAQNVAQKKKNLRKTPQFWLGIYEEPELVKPSGQAWPDTSSLAAAPEMQPEPMPAEQEKPPEGGRRMRSRRQTFRSSGLQTSMFSKSVSKKLPSLVKTAFGFSPAKHSAVTYAASAGKTMPLGVILQQAERVVLNALGSQADMSAGEIGALLGEADSVAWMASFMTKLATLGLDLVAEAGDRDGEPTYCLVR